jgi:hypothetical protein
VSSVNGRWMIFGGEVVHVKADSSDRVVELFLGHTEDERTVNCGNIHWFSLEQSTDILYMEDHSLYKVSNV